MSLLLSHLAGNSLERLLVVSGSLIAVIVASRKFIFMNKFQCLIGILIVISNIIVIASRSSINLTLVVRKFF